MLRMRIMKLIRDLEEVNTVFSSFEKRKVIYEHREWSWSLPINPDLSLKFDVYFSPDVCHLVDDVLASNAERLNFIYRDCRERPFFSDDFMIDFNMDERLGRLGFYVIHGGRFIADVSELPDVVAVSRNDMGYSVIVILKTYPHLDLGVFVGNNVLRKYRISMTSGLYNDAVSFLKLIVNIVTGKALFSTA